MKKKIDFNNEVIKLLLGELRFESQFQFMNFNYRN